MNLKGHIIPHPVLGQADDIKSNYKLTDPLIIIKGDEYEISFEVQHDNVDLLTLAMNGSAIHCCEVFCSGTFYRECFTNTSLKFTFVIDRRALKGRVRFQVYCLANTTLSSYVNAAAHTDYDGITFGLDRGDILAFFGEFEFNADIQYHKLKSASSFMEIVPHHANEQMTEYVFDTNKIQIRLPKELYDKFKSNAIIKNKEFAGLVHGSIVQSALTMALVNYQKALDAGGCIWAESIRHRLLTEPELNNGSEQFDSDRVPFLVQKLLGNPVERLVNSLDDLATKAFLEE